MLGSSTHPISLDNEVEDDPDFQITEVRTNSAPLPQPKPVSMQPKTSVSLPSDLSSAPFGYTKAGKPRKRAPPERVGICPIKDCKKSFQHRQDPEQAVYQHLRGYKYSETEKGKAHEKAYEKLKKDKKVSTQTAVEKKESHRASVKKWAAKNPEAAKRAAAYGNFKLKARRHLKKEGKEIDEILVKEMADRWMKAKDESAATCV